jgi:hypothetical protein
MVRTNVDQVPNLDQEETKCQRELDECHARLTVLDHELATSSDLNTLGTAWLERQTRDSAVHLLERRMAALHDMQKTRRRIEFGGLADDTVQELQSKKLGPCGLNSARPCNS